MSLQSSLSTEIDLLNDSDEEKQPIKTSYKLVCWLVNVFQKKERPAFYTRKRIEREKHIEEMAVEGPEAFQKM